MLLAVTFFVTVAFVAREVQSMRERVTTDRAMANLRLEHQAIRDGAKRVAEDLVVTQHVLAERGLVGQSDMLRARARLIEGPKRRAKQKRHLAQHLKPQQVHLLVEDREGNVH